MSNIKLFESKQIRSEWIESEQKWYFSVQDVVEVLTDSADVKQYIKRILSRDEILKSNWGTICTLVEMKAADGKNRKVQASDTKGLLRIIQSIPSPKAEPFKQWLAQVGSDRLDEIENPELAAQRTRELYKAKGYPDEWIEKRMRSIAIREELTEEWKNRGVKEQLEYAILTAEISKATFGLTPKEYKHLKGLKSQNLRDHMTDLELIFSMLGEASTTKVTRAKNAKGFIENKKAAKIGGKIAGNALKELEKESGEKVITSENYLPETKKIKELKIVD
ncbi:MAG: phage antirepressor protein [Bacteroidetes bacterium GWA2_30_7]|nr:MAG: phage antirepressor protein [Bacteroidetes bacterium GWA2_30_7]